MKKEEKIKQLAERLRNEDLKKLGWRLVKVWGVYRDEAEYIYKKINRN